MTDKLSPYLHSREAQVDFICDFGGYYSRHEKWPIVFTVSAYKACLEFDSLWDKYHKEFLPASVSTPAEVAAYRVLCEAEYESVKDNLFWWACEDAREGYEESFEMRAGKNRLVEVTFSFVSSGGKRMALKRFDGRTLSGVSPDGLRDDMLSQDDDWCSGAYSGYTLRRGCTWTSWSSKDVRTLYQFLRYASLQFNTTTASHAVEYSAASVLFCCCESDYFFSSRTLDIAEESVSE
jgi:hypothetical protein